MVELKVYLSIKQECLDNPSACTGVNLYKTDRCLVNING